MRHNYEVLAAEKIENAIGNALKRRAQLIDSVPQQISDRTPEFVAVGCKLTQVDKTFPLSLYRNGLESFEKVDFLVLFVQDHFRFRHVSCSHLCERASIGLT